MKFLHTKLAATSALLATAALTFASCSGGDQIDPHEQVKVQRDFAATQTTTVITLTQPVWYEAVGTVVAAQTIDIAPQINGHILEMLVEVGQEVQVGTALLRIDDRTIQARAAQAQAGVAAAEATAKQAVATRKRVDRLFEREAATSEQVEAATAADLQAQAVVQQALQVLNEAKTMLSYAQLISPVDGVIAKRFADAGDLALPGHPLLQIHSGSQMDFVAAIRESKIGKIAVGNEVQVDFPSAGLRVPAVIREFNPAGDPTTRSFFIKASLPANTLVRSGMYGKLMLQTGKLQVTAIPAAAVSRVGQLETVMVKTDGGWQRRFVRTGSELEGGFFEILSGLSTGETIGWKQ